MRFDIITIFPEAFTSYFDTSILKRARKSKCVDIRVHDLRNHTTDKHRTVDDKPYGGGAGMVMKVEPIFRAVTTIQKKAQGSKLKARCILLAASGKQFDQRMVERFAKLDQLALIAGHYEGVDERVMEFVDEAVSVGPYVLTGGELPAMTIVDAVTRLVPGVLGNPKSLEEESFIITKAQKHLSTKTHLLPTPYSLLPKEYPHYTRPETFSPHKKTHWRVPKVLLGGDHQKIAEWREKHKK